jgi:hypothetical protein
MKKSEFEAKRREFWRTGQHIQFALLEQKVGDDIAAAEAAGVKWEEEDHQSGPVLVAGDRLLAKAELEAVARWWREGPSVNAVVDELEKWERDISVVVDIPRFSESLRMSLLTRRVRS